VVQPGQHTHPLIRTILVAAPAQNITLTAATQSGKPASHQQQQQQVLHYKPGALNPNETPGWPLERPASGSTLESRPGPSVALHRPPQGTTAKTTAPSPTGHSGGQLEVVVDWPLQAAAAPASPRGPVGRKEGQFSVYLSRVSPLGCLDVP